MSLTLVLKFSSNLSSDTGTVIPIAIENDDGSVRATTPEEYPNNNRIFISKEYSTIDSKYGDLELFVLTKVNESEDHNEDITSHSKFYSMGFYAKSLDTNTYLPIISMAMPDIASGRVEQGPPIDIGNRHFFILNNEIVSGPFLAQAEEDIWLIAPTNTTSPLALNSHHVAQFNLNELEDAGLILRSSMGGNDRLFFTSLKKAKDEVGFQSKDYISDSALIRFFAKQDFGKSIGNITKAEATKLAALIDAFSKKIKVTSNDERRIRIDNVLEKYIKFDGIGVDVVQNYWNTKSGKIFLEEYASTNRNSLLKDKIAEIEKAEVGLQEKYERETADILGKLEDKRKELIQFELDMDRKKNDRKIEMEILIAQTKEQEQSALRNRNDTLMAEIESNEGKLSELKLRVGSYESLEKLNKEFNKKENQLEYLRGEEAKVKGLVETQRNYISSPQIVDKGLEFKTMQMLLNGISPDTSDLIVRPIILPKHGSHVTGETRQSYINSLKIALEQSSGRPYNHDETANLLLCTLQSYITILAGPPGTGKTSTATRFADALGLIAKQKSSLETDNFLSIPIGRGWVSSRDMLGFYNSLKNTYQPSRSGLYSFLKAFSVHEDNSEKTDFLKLVLMDEANLSVVEHYWSDFLLMCDSLEKNNKIDLGIADKKERFLEIPSSLRFMGTINNDASVEGLTSRLIDRAAIITLGYGADSGTANTQGNILSGAVPYKELMDAFSPKNDEEEMEPFESARLKQVLELLSMSSIKGTQIHFSQRKLNAITRYCYIANQLNFEKIEPLDFAISQHILPSIKGNGQGLRERLQLLEEKMGEFKYSVSRKIILSIIDAGDDFSDSYSFF